MASGELRSVVAGAVLAAALLGAGGGAHAAERLTVRWSAPEGCPDAADLKAEVDRLLGGSQAPAGKPIEVTAALSRDASGTWHVRLETPAEGAARVRELHGASCRAITAAAALILALMIDPDAVAVAPPAPAASSAPTSTAPPVAPAAPPSPAPTSPAPPAVSSSPVAPSRLPSSPPRRTPPPPPSSPPSFSFRVSAWAGADLGTLPGISAGFGLAGSLVAGAQRFELGLAVRPARTATLPARPGAGGSVDLVTGSAGTCRHLLTRPVLLAPCAAIEVGRLHAVGFGVSTPSEASLPWVGLSAGGLLVWSPAAPLGLVLRIDAAVPLARPIFVLEGVGVVHEPAAIAGRASVGLEIGF